MTAPTIQLNDFQRNALQAGFKYIDRLLSEALSNLAPANEDAIFAPTFPDATAVQHRVIVDQAARMRRAIRSALDACAIPISPPDLGALRNLHSTLISIDIALDEMGPDHLRGYGSIDAADAGGVNAVLAQVRTTVTELLAYLGSGRGGDLSARLARLDQTRDEVRLLKEIERIVTAHGLVELRATLSRLLERLERNWWTVAFVGRVSSGKSSLLNYLLETDVLPAGVTPITSVPIRIVGGTTAAATVFFANDKPRLIPAGELAEFASEERNPGNARCVTDVLLGLPAARLEGDVCFVDTPGLGSLATAGAAQTLAFLPRCDLGVLLLDAASTFGEEETAVARALLENGADVLLVVSKADLLTVADRDKVLAYARRQFAVALGRELPAAPVSVAGGHTAMTDHWLAAELAPRQARHRELAATALRRKIGALRATVEARVAVRADPARMSAGPAQRIDTAALGATRAAIETARRGLYDLAYEATPPEEEVISDVAGALVAARTDGEFPDAVAQELARAAARLGAMFEARLRAAREEAAGALVQSIGNSREGAGLAQPSGRPLFDPGPLLATAQLSTSWRSWPAGFLRRFALRRHLSSRLDGRLDEALKVYSRTLIAWSERYLDELTAQFNAQAGLAEVRSNLPSAPREPAENLQRDLELLRQWSAQATP